MSEKSIISQVNNKILRSPIIKGTLILTITGIVTRFIGFYNRIFLNNLIGAKELGIYQLIFPLYVVAFSITTMGNELALTKLVSEYIGHNDISSARSFFKTCFVINFILGTIISLIFYFNSDSISILVLNASSCGNCIRTLSIGIPFMAMKGAIHGYFMGMKKSEVHGISDFLEQLSKVFGLYIIASYLTSVKNYTASFAVIGIVLGEIVSFIFSLIALFIHFHKTSKSSKTYTHYPKRVSRPINRQKVISLFFKDSIPLTANRFALTLLQSTEAILIPTYLLEYYRSSALSLSTYGIFSGMAFPFIMFPATITNSLSVMLLPAVSGAYSELKTEYLKHIIQKSIVLCLIIGISSGTVFFLCGRPVGYIVFHNKEAGIFLYQLSFLCPLIYLSTNLASILNGLGLATHNLILTVISTSIRLGAIILLIPHYGMQGYIIGLFVSYIFQTLSSSHKLNKVIRE